MAYSNQLNRVIKLIGPQAAIRMSRLYGGRAYRAPKKENLHDMHPLVVAIGLACAERLCEAFESEPLKFPHEVTALRQIRDELIWQRASAGESLSKIAIWLQIDRKKVQDVIHTFEKRGRPLDANRIDGYLSLGLQADLFY